MDARGEVMLKDALYNTHWHSGSSVDYGKGVVVGMVAGMMAMGVSFGQACSYVVRALPVGYREECIPLGWEQGLTLLDREGVPL